MVGHRRPPLAARRAWSSARLKHALALGASLVALAAAPAYARMRPAPAIPEPQATPVAEPEQTGPGPDTLDPNSFYLEADVVAQDNKTQVATAQGHVEVRYRGRTLRSDFLAYDKNTQVVTARGNVVIVNPDGTSEFAKELTLDKDLSAGVALGFSARLQQNIKIASDTLIRRSADVTELNDAIYTPCDVCAKNGDSKTPTWSIQARRVVQDKAHHLIYFHKAVIRVLG
ncbi:MAG TPA: hypothetical protein VHX64_07870, partial [Caulobacteraceae bacterium]|nr:hypothetical protein [Caulobacteraceae bacterium]